MGNPENSFNPGKIDNTQDTFSNRADINNATTKQTAWTRRRFVVGAATLAGAVTLVGCGDEVGATPVATVNAPVVPGLTKITALAVVSSLNQKMDLRVGYMPYTDHITVPLVVGKIGKDFKFANVKAEQFQKWVPGLDKLKAGQLDVMFTFVPPLFTRFGTEEIPAKVVLLAHRNGLYIFSKNGINKPQDLKGKIFAVPDKQSNYYVMAAKFLKQSGLTFDAGGDVKFVEYSLSDMGNALRNGDIDAFIQSGPASAVLEKQGVGKILEYSANFSPNHLDCVVLMRNEIIEKFPDVAQEFVTGTRKAISDFGLDQKNNKGAVDDKLKEAARISAPFLNADMDSVYQALKQPDSAIIFSNPEPTLKDFQDLQADWNKVVSIGNATLNMANIIETRFAK